MTANEGPGRTECPGCGKHITVRKNGTYRHHRSHLPEWPGSPFKKLCDHSGKSVGLDGAGS